MSRKRGTKRLASVLLFVMIAFVFVGPAYAYEPIGGDNVLIERGETIDDNVYALANTFTLRGVIKGDLIAIGREIIIAEGGVVEGDLVVMGQSIVVKGSVRGDMRVGATVVNVDENAAIGGELVGVSYSLEISPNSSVGGDLVFFGRQLWQSGDIAGDALISVTAFRLDGNISGNVNANLGDTQDAPPIDPMQFMPGMPAIPRVQPGLTFNEDAQIGGDLTYTSSQTSEIPGGSVGGRIRRIEPVLAEVEEEIPAPTAGELFLGWLLSLARRLASLLVVGFLLARLFPHFLYSSAGVLRATPLPSMSWGLMVFFAYFALLVVIILATVLFAVIFSILTLNKLTLVTIWGGLVTVGGYLLAFRMVTYYLVYILVGILIGQLFFERVNAKVADNHFWQMTVGLLILSILAATPYFGFMINLVVLFLGLGALWLQGRTWYHERSKNGIPKEIDV